MSAEDGETTGLPIIGWFDGPIKHSISSVFHGINEIVESLDLFGRYHRAHVGSLRNEVQSVKLLGMSAPVKLVDIYNPARVSTTIKRRLYAEEWMGADGASNAPVKNIKKKTIDLVDGDAYVEANDRVVILGGPGAGKTTFLKFLALAYIDKAIFDKSNLKRSKLPFFVPLPVFYRGDRSIFDFILDPIKEKTNEHSLSFLTRLLDSGSAVVLLDSLDEVPKSERPKVVARIREFSSRFPHTKVVLSCRTADFNEPLESFCEVEIAKLDKGSVHKIVRAWFHDDAKKARELCAVIDHEKGVSSLTETPLLLSLLCIQFRHDLLLPKRKVELFKRCSEALLRDWDTTRGFRRDSSYETLTDQAKEKLFESIAGQFTLDVFTYIFPQSKVIEIVSEFCSVVGIDPGEASNIVDEIDQHHGILERFSQEHYGFSHTSFQEYFAARYIVAKNFGYKVVANYFDEEEWYSIIEFVVSMSDNPEDIIDLLIAKSNLAGLTNYPPMAKRTGWLHLLYRCLATGPYLSVSARQRAIDHLIRSQFEIARIYGEGGVFPVAQLLPDGIRHPFFWVHKRSSLSSALQPFRRFSNEILKAPVTGYADAVIKALPDVDIRFAQAHPLLREALFLNLITPLAKTHGKYVEELIRERFGGEGGISSMARMADVTLGTIARDYSA